MVNFKTVPSDFCRLTTVVKLLDKISALIKSFEVYDIVSVFIGTKASPSGFLVGDLQAQKSQKLLVGELALERDFLGGGTSLVIIKNGFFI